jgi:hypothetical protein
VDDSEEMAKTVANPSGTAKGRNRPETRTKSQPPGEGRLVIMDNTPECNRLRKLCREHIGKAYPPRSVSNIFEHLREEMYIETSGICGAGDGLHIKSTFVKGQIVGVYEGIEVEETDGDYVLEIERGGNGVRWINADPAVTDRVSIFGKMNEDLHEGEYNAEIGEDGFIKMLTDCTNGELLTRYGPKYNWDQLKQKALLGLVNEVEKIFPSMRSKIMRSWVDVKASSCALHTWVRKVIEGRCGLNELHGILCHEDLEPLNSEEERMMIYLTFGPTSTKFNYKHFGHPIKGEVLTTEIKASRSGRRIKELSKR